MSPELPACFVGGQNGLQLPDTLSGRDADADNWRPGLCTGGRAPRQRAVGDFVTSQGEVTQQIPPDITVLSKFEKCLILLTLDPFLCEVDALSHFECIHLECFLLCKIKLKKNYCVGS